MNCREALKAMQEFIDDELDLDIHQDFILHAKACDKCQTKLKEQQRLIYRLSNTFQHQGEAPASLMLGIFQKLLRQPRKGRFTGK